MALARAGFVLGIKPVSVLRPHEEVIKKHVGELAEEMTREGVQKDPIIVDRESLTVLDGMHRLAAFELLGVENAVCCSVDYSTSAVTLGRWARVYIAPDRESAAEALRDSGITRKATYAGAYEALDRRADGLAVLTSAAAYLPDRRIELGEAIAVIEDIDERSQAKGWKRLFVPEDEVDVHLQSAGSMVVLLRRLGKDDVVAAARSGNLFPCKTSMHRIDPRPVAVNFPMAELNSATSASLARALAGREERLLPAGSTYEGRRYKERLLLLSQP